MIDKYIRRHGQRLYGLCLTLCGNAADADDLYQDTWLKALKNFDKYDESKPFEPWITRICVNLFRDRLRRLSKDPVFDRFSSPEEKEAAMENAPQRQPEDYAALREAVSALPVKLRITVILFYFKDNDLRQTAEILGIPEGTAKSRLNRARRLLREALKGE